MLIVRRAEEKDAECVHSLMEKLEEPQKFPFEPFCRNYSLNLANSHLIYLIAEDNGVVLAFGSLAISTPLHHAASVVEIVELIVDDQSRGMNVGTKLIHEMMRITRERGCCSLEVTSNRIRKRAHHFYERHGFMPTHLKLTLDMLHDEDQSLDLCTTNVM